MSTQVFSAISGTAGVVIEVPDNTTGVISTPPEGSQTPYVTGSPTVGNIPSFSDTSGNLQDSEIASTNVQLKNVIKAQKVNYAGGAASFTISAPGITTNSIVTANFSAQINAVSIQLLQPVANELNIICSDDPGASTIDYIAFAGVQ